VTDWPLTGRLQGVSAKCALSMGGVAMTMDQSGGGTILAGAAKVDLIGVCFDGSGP